MTPRPVRVLVADDHPMFLAGLCASLRSDPLIEVVAEACDGAQAVALTLETAPDLVLMDLHMPVSSGIEAIAQIRAQAPDVRVLVLTMFEDPDSVFAAMRVGARGYLLKGAAEDDLLRAVHLVADGGLLFGPAIAELVSSFFATRADHPPQAFEDLTIREREILELVARGATNAAISQQLVLSQKTVRNHVSNIFTKLAVSDRGHAIVLAREAGLGTDAKSRD